MRATPQLAICTPLGHQAEWLREWDYASCCEHLPTSQQHQLLLQRCNRRFDVLELSRQHLQHLPRHIGQP